MRHYRSRTVRPGDRTRHPSMLRLVVGAAVLLSACRSARPSESPATPGEARSTPTPALTRTPAEAAGTPTRYPTVMLPTPTSTPSMTPSATDLPITASAPDSGLWHTLDIRSAGFAVDYPPDYEARENHWSSWSLSAPAVDPDGRVQSFVYVSVIPSGFESGGGDIYNFNTREAEFLWNLAVGESGSEVSDLESQPWFTYTRYEDALIGGQVARRYEIATPWEFPKEIVGVRYYVFTPTRTYLIGGYITEVEATDPTWITRATFDRIVATIRFTTAP